MNLTRKVTIFTLLSATGEGITQLEQKVNFVTVKILDYLKDFMRLCTTNVLDLVGEFNDYEFQNFCHNLSEEKKEEFFKGCNTYQNKLFGQSERQRLFEQLKPIITEQKVVALMMRVWNFVIGL